MIIRDLAALVRKGDLANQPTIDDKVRTNGVIMCRDDRHYLALLPPLPAE